MIDSTLSTFTASDGENLVLQDWPVPGEATLHGVILLVHGLGEHAGRYEHVAQQLASWGYAVRGYDQYGHGDSGGTRGVLTSPMRLLDDLADIIDGVRMRMDASTPLILLGHSLGGLVVSRFVSLRLRPVQGLVLSSPALDAGLGGFQKLLLAILPSIAPNLCVGNGLNPQFLSHDPAVVRAYQADPLVHDRISPRLGRFIADNGPATIACASDWTTPTLLMYAGDDRLVSPAGSRAFAQAAPAAIVRSHCFEHMYHELFNEPDQLLVFEELRRWLKDNFE
jgi:alpha-beta hydrolase superfamily lysophospholipase